MKSELSNLGSHVSTKPEASVKLQSGVDPFPILLFKLPLPQPKSIPTHLIRVHTFGITELGLEDLEDDGLTAEEIAKVKRKNKQRAAARARYLAKKKLNAEAYEAYREARRQQQRRYYKKMKTAMEL